MVKDHRTGVETANVMAVLDGDLDRFVEAYLKQSKRQAAEGAAAATRSGSGDA
jgi:protein subunit release factor A